MNKLMSLAHVFWPWLEKRSEEEARRVEDRNNSDRERIGALKFSRAPTLVLDEIRRLADSEAERRRGTEQKAATYLPLVAALIPLVLTVVGALWEKKAGGAPTWANMILLGLAVAYTAAAGWWAFKVLKVAMSHEVGLGDFEVALAEQNPTATFASRLLLHARRNQDGIDWKVSCIKMAHEFLLRAFLAFSLLLMMNIGWFLVGALLNQLHPGAASKLQTAQDVGEAIARIDSLAAEMRDAPAWRVLETRCLGQTRERSTLKYVAGPITISDFVAPPLNISKAEPIATRTIRLDCAGKTVAQMRVWFLPTYLSNMVPTETHPFPRAARTTVSVKKAWPPSTSAAPSNWLRLPPVLLSQAATALNSEGAPIGFIVTNIGPGSVDR